MTLLVRFPNDDKEITMGPSELVVARVLTPLRVLLVEDSDEDAEILLAELARAGYEVSAERVQTAEDLRAALQRGSWQVVLSDYSLPQFNAPAALTIVRQVDQDLPFIIVSGTIGEETAVDALRAGASDFLLKGKWARLAPAVDRELRDADARRERQAAEQQFREAQARSSYALDAAGAGIWEFDRASGLTRWTERVSAIFGLDPTPVETTLDEFRTRVHQDDRPVIEATLARSMQTDTPYGVEFRVPWPDGTVHWVASKGRVTRNSAGEPTGMMGIAVDVTERRELEQQLQYAQKMESLGALAGGIAHDFDNVLNAVIGFSDLLLNDLDTADPRARDVTQIRKAGESGQLLTRQLLAFSRQQSLQPTRVDLNAVVATTKVMLQQLVGSPVRLETVLGSPLGHVWADAGQLQQILMNLAVNARDAMPAGGRLLFETYAVPHSDSGRTGHADLTGPQAVLSVTDTGTGMSPEIRARIFEPLFTTKAPDKGTGLGLSTVYGIVRQSGGAIDVMSTLGEGTTFRIYLPLLDPVEAESM